MEVSTTEKIRIIAGRKDLNITQLAEKIGQTRQNLSNKMTRGDFKESELKSIAESLDCNLKILFVDKKTGEQL